MWTNNTLMVTREIVTLFLIFLSKRTSAMIFITTKNMLKLLVNNMIHIFADTTHSETWNHWPVHARRFVCIPYHFHTLAYVFASSENSASWKFLLENVSHLHQRVYGRNAPFVKFTLNNDSDAALLLMRSYFLMNFVWTVLLI